jgi:hypothetical protein
MTLLVSFDVDATYQHRLLYVVVYGLKPMGHISDEYAGANAANMPHGKPQSSCPIIKATWFGASVTIKTKGIIDAIEYSMVKRYPIRSTMYPAMSRPRNEPTVDA